MKQSLTEQDQIFAEEIAKDFDLPLKGLTSIIYTLRTMIEIKGQKNSFSSVERIKCKDLIRILEAPDFEVTTIHIETAGDVIHLFKDDPLFHYFNRSITLFRDKFKNDIIAADKKTSKQINGWAERQIFRHFTFYFRNSSLTQTEQINVIGNFLVHFGIKYREPIMTYDQWLNNPGRSDGYPDYLYGRLKNRYKYYKKKLLT